MLVFLFLLTTSTLDISLHAGCSIHLWHLQHTLDLARSCFSTSQFFGEKVSLIFPIINLTVDLISNLHIGLSDLVNPLIFTRILDDTINPLGLLFQFYSQLILNFIEYRCVLTLLVFI